MESTTDVRTATSGGVSDAPSQQMDQLQTSVEKLKAELNIRQQQLQQIENQLSTRQSQINTLTSYVAQQDRRNKPGFFERIQSIFRKQR